MAKRGWVKENNGKWYFYDDNGAVQKGWLKHRETWYYLMENGEMASSRWIQDSKSKKWYYMTHTGEMAVSSWKQDRSGKWYYLRSNGEMAVSQMRKGKDGNSYYLGADGAMVTRGEVIWEGEPYYVKKNGICNKIKEIITKQNLSDIGWREKLLTESMLLKLNSALNEYDITNINSIRHFLAQCSVETGYGEILVERHSSKFPSAEEYFRGRDLKDGNTIPGSPAKENDGAKYRGAGYIQITWKEAYYKFAEYVGDEEILNKGCFYVAQNYPWESAGWFWSVFKRLNAKIKEEPDIGVERVTRIVNGGYTALDRRIEAYNKCCEKIQ